VSTDGFSLQSLAQEHLGHARASAAGRSAHTLFGGHDHRLRQTLIALRAGQRLEEHESPGEATLQVLLGRVLLTAGAESHAAGAGDLLPIPPARHALAAEEDAVVLLTVVKPLGPGG
jgi:quercetin dioxygenase-like cupin family protein